MRQLDRNTVWPSSTTGPSGALQTWSFTCSAKQGVCCVLTVVLFTTVLTAIVERKMRSKYINTMELHWQRNHLDLAEGAPQVAGCMPTQFDMQWNSCSHGWCGHETEMLATGDRWSCYAAHAFPTSLIARDVQVISHSLELEAQAELGEGEVHLSSTVCTETVLNGSTSPWHGYIV